MPHELTDEEWAYYQGRKQVADFVETIWNDPTLSSEAKRLVKKKYPQVQIPDFDIEEKVTARLDKEKQEREEAERKRAESEQEKHFKDLRAKTQQEYGFTDEGMKDLEQFMLDNNVGSYEVAASYRASKQPKPSDADADPGRDHFWNHAKQDGFAAISADPEGWARKELLTAIRKDEQKAKGSF